MGRLCSVRTSRPRSRRAFAHGRGRHRLAHGKPLPRLVRAFYAIVCVRALTGYDPVRPPPGQAEREAPAPRRTRSAGGVCSSSCRALRTCPGIHDKENAKRLRKAFYSFPSPPPAFCAQILCGRGWRPVRQLTAVGCGARCPIPRSAIRVSIRRPDARSWQPFIVKRYFRPPKLQLYTYMRQTPC